MTLHDGEPHGDRGSGQGEARAPRYCTTCGEIFSDWGAFCPQCGMRWQAPLFQNTNSLAVLLNELARMRGDDVLTPACYASARAVYEERLLRVRPARLQPATVAAAPAPAIAPAAAPAIPAATPRRAPSSPPSYAPHVPPRRRGLLGRLLDRVWPEEEPAATAVAPASASPVAARPVAPPVPPKPPKPPRPSLTEWAAARQADILLYLGAFLLTIAALIFTNYQGAALNGPARFAILAVYTAAFLGLGLALPRWDRVKEAGPVFLALGAILVPVSFLALRSQVVSRDTFPDDVLLLIGSSLCAGLYTLLARRGHGRFYAVPGIAAALLAWGALASSVDIPRTWFGVWYLALAAALHIANERGHLPAPVWSRVGVFSAGGTALLVSYAFAVSMTRPEAMLSVSAALILAALAGGLCFRRSVIALVLLPLAGLLAAITWTWSIVDIHEGWATAYIALAALGYLLIAEFDGEGAPHRWARGAVALGPLALLAAFSAVTADAPRAALPLAAAILLIGASGSAWRWRWTAAFLLLPPLAALVLGSAAWAAFDLPLAWTAPFIALAALGYLLVTAVTPAEQARSWGGVAAFSGTLALGAALIAVADGEARAVLPLTAALLLTGAAVATLRWRWIEAFTLLPPLLCLTLWSAAWAAALLALDWGAAFLALAGLGYLLVALLTPEEQAQDWGLAAFVMGATALGVAFVAMLDGAPRALLPVTAALTLSTALWAAAGWRWTAAFALAPPLTALTVTSTAWASTGMDLAWMSPFIVAAGLGYLGVALLTPAAQSRAWGAAAAITATLGLALAIPATVNGTDAVLPVSAALALTGSAFAAWRWRWTEAFALLPALAALSFQSAGWATFSLDHIWAAPVIAVAALGYLLIATFSRSAPASSWASVWAAASALALMLGWLGALVAGPHLVLPLTTAIILAGAAYAAWRWRWSQVLMLLPPLAALTGATAWWAAAGLAPVWYGVAWAGMAAGYLALHEARPHDPFNWRAWAAVSALAALLIPFGAIDEVPGQHWAAPVTHALLTLLAAWDAARRRDWAVLLPPALAATTATGVLWAARVDAAWWAYPWLATAALLVAAEPWLRTLRPARLALWPYVLTLAALTPVALSPRFAGHPAHGAISYSAAVVLLLAIAIQSRGALARTVRTLLDTARRDTTATRDADAMVQRSRHSLSNQRAAQLERVALGRLAGLYLFAAAAWTNAWLGATGAEQSWLFLGAGVAAWLGLTLFGRRREALEVLAPLGVTALALAALIARHDPMWLMLACVAGTAGPLLAALTVRRPLLWAVAAVFGAPALFAAWDWAGWDRALLPLAFVAVATAPTAALAPLRDYTRTERGIVTTLLTWGYWALALTAAWSTMYEADTDLSRTNRLTATLAWDVFTLTVAAASLAVFAEGLRLRRPTVWVSATAGLLLAVLLGIARFDPANIQAYTLPVGLYLLGFGILWRRSPDLIAPHLYMNEALMVAGMLFLALPPAEQSFAPGGALFGLELIGLGVLLLAAGLLLGFRWLTLGGVVVFTAVALRWVVETNVPYWLALGVTGMALLGVGMLVLLQRDVWDRTRRRLSDWWEDGLPAGR